MGWMGAGQTTPMSNILDIHISGHEAKMNKLAINAHNLHERLVTLKGEIMGRGLMVGKILYEIQENELYLTLGYDTFETYIADPDLAFKRSTAYKLKGIYEQWVLNFGYKIEDLKPIAQDKLIEAGKVAHEETKDEWLEKARSLSRSDLNIETAEAKGKVVHDIPPRPSKCDICGKWKLPDNLICKGHD